MTLTKRMLNQLEESMWLPMSQAQKAAILEHFGAAPEPYEWTEEDIIIQIRNFIGCGQFVKEAAEGEPCESWLADQAAGIPF